MGAEQKSTLRTASRKPARSVWEYGCGWAHPGSEHASANLGPVQAPHGTEVVCDGTRRTGAGANEPKGRLLSDDKGASSLQHVGRRYPVGSQPLQRPRVRAQTDQRSRGRLHRGVALPPALQGHVAHQPSTDTHAQTCMHDGSKHGRSRTTPIERQAVPDHHRVSWGLPVLQQVQWGLRSDRFPSQQTGASAQRVPAEHPRSATRCCEWQTAGGGPPHVLCSSKQWLRHASTPTIKDGREKEDRRAKEHGGSACLSIQETVFLPKTCVVGLAQPPGQEATAREKRV